MTIPENVWAKYITRLRRVNNAAAASMKTYLETHDVTGETGLQDAIAYAYGLATKYGEGAAALAAEMYDAVALLSGQVLPAAEPAATATVQEVAQTITGMLKRTRNTDAIGASVGRLVKLAGMDTTLKNAVRDGAQWAWIPRGETCAFCITLASRGWQRASQSVLKGGHATHVHANCDCMFAIRYNDKTDYAGYDPQKYLRIYEDAPLDGDAPTSKNRINAMRREFYAENRTEINAQKRSAYEKRAELNAGAAEEADV